MNCLGYPCLNSLVVAGSRFVLSRSEAGFGELETIGHFNRGSAKKVTWIAFAQIAISENEIENEVIEEKKPERIPVAVEECNVDVHARAAVGCRASAQNKLSSTPHDLLCSSFSLFFWVFHLVFLFPPHP